MTRTTQHARGFDMDLPHHRVGVLTYLDGHVMMFVQDFTKEAPQEPGRTAILTAVEAREFAEQLEHAVRLAEYTPQVREEAADALACCASNPETYFMNVLDEGSPAERLALAAFSATFHGEFHTAGAHEHYAEAEAMLRTGWTP
jgi:hypothetical protein